MVLEIHLCPDPLYFTDNSIIPVLSCLQANEQKRRYESVMKICKQANPTADLTNFVVAQSTEPYEKKVIKFQPPTDTSIPGSEVVIANTIGRKSTIIHL